MDIEVDNVFDPFNLFSWRNSFFDPVNIVFTFIFYGFDCLSSVLESKVHYELIDVKLLSCLSLVLQSLNKGVENIALNENFKILFPSLLVVLRDAGNDFLYLSHVLKLTASIVSKSNQELLFRFKQTENSLVEGQSNVQSSFLFESFLIQF